jgi:hypothetical protein
MIQRIINLGMIDRRVRGPWETERQPRSSYPHAAEPEQLRGPFEPVSCKAGPHRRTVG